MMRNLALALLFVTSAAVADQKVNGHPTPLPDELLDNPVALSDQCKRTFIKEWRGRPMTDAHVEVMNNVCNLVVDNFYDFVKDKGYPADNKVLPRYSISVIPITDHYRSLNDNRYRFKDRPLFCGKDARHCRPGDSPWFLYGWTDKQNEYHFIRSDLQISESKDANAFRVIFAHELFHQLSWESGSFMTHGNAQIEEALAHSFTRYIGLGDI